MAQFDQFANQGGAAAWDPTKTAEAKRVAEEQLQNADYSGTVPEPLGRNAAAHGLDGDSGDGDANDFSDAGLEGDGVGATGLEGDGVGDAGIGAAEVGAKDDGHDKNGGGDESAAPRY